MKKSASILLIIVSTLISVAVATGWVNYGAIELGALFYYFVPVIAGFATVIAFILADIRFRRFRTGITISLIIFNLLVGILMRLDFYIEFGRLF
jgi:hypothetical protein